MKTRTLLIAFGLFLIVGMPRLFTLDAHWSSDETRWLGRSSRFMHAVQTGQFDQTLQAYHPGVTTMWLAGTRSFFGNNETWRSLKDLVLGRWFICVVVSAGLVVVFFLLLRLFETWHTVTAWGFIAMSPFFLAETRRVHTDALATIFILLTVLLFLLYCVTLLRMEEHRQKKNYLVFAGIVFGIACLSKSYSVILLPWIPICLWLFRRGDRSWHLFLYDTFITVILFLSYSILTVFGLASLLASTRATVRCMPLDYYPFSTTCSSNRQTRSPLCRCCYTCSPCMYRLCCKNLLACFR